VEARGVSLPLPIASFVLAKLALNKIKGAYDERLE